MKMNNKRGQVTIFIIIAIVIVALVVLFFIFKDKIVEPSPSTNSKSLNPNSFLKTCMEDKVEETIRTLSYQGGYMENSLNVNFQFENEPSYNISYLCYTNSYSTPCNSIQPLLINHLKEEIKTQIDSYLEDCFNDLVLNYEDDGYEITKNEYNDFELNLNYGKITINLNAKLTLKKAGQTNRKKDFEIEFPTKLYDLLLVSNEIINQEAKYCSFNNVGYMFLYPEFKIDKQNYAPNQTKIYTVEDKTTNEKFRFCVRSCVPSPLM